MNGQRTTIVAALSALALIATAANSLSVFSWFVSLIVMLGAVVWRVIAPGGMRQVVRAVREMPEHVVLLRHSTASASIEIKTATHGLTVDAGNAPWLLDALMRRCPTAKVELR